MRTAGEEHGVRSGFPAAVAVASDLSIVFLKYMQFKCISQSCDPEYYDSYSTDMKSKMCPIKIPTKLACLASGFWPEDHDEGSLIISNVHHLSCHRDRATDGPDKRTF